MGFWLGQAGEHGQDNDVQILFGSGRIPKPICPSKSYSFFNHLYLEAIILLILLDEKGWWAERRGIEGRQGVVHRTQLKIEEPAGGKREQSSGIMLKTPVTRLFKYPPFYNIQIMHNEPITLITNQLSRNELLNWINFNTHSTLSKVEQLGTGISYCQIIDLIHPRLIHHTKMNLKAKSEYQFINNFKLLQQCFSKLGIYKNIEIEKLTKCKYQDNLEFLQWFHKYFEGQLTRKDGFNNSSRNDSQNRSRPKRASSFMIPTNISKIEGKMVDGGSFEDVMVLEDLGKNHSHHHNQQQVTDFYKSKLLQIQQLVESWDTTKLSGNLRDSINDILLTPPPIIQSEIHFDINKNKDE